MTIELGVFIAILGLAISFMAYQLNRTKEVKSDTQNDAEIKTRLDYIGKGVDDIRIDLRANESRMRELGERVTRLEESSKSAHKRLDSIEKEGVKNE